MPLEWILHCWWVEVEGESSENFLLVEVLCSRTLCKLSEQVFVGGPEKGVHLAQHNCVWYLRIIYT